MFATKQGEYVLYLSKLFHIHENLPNELPDAINLVTDQVSV